MEYISAGSARPIDHDVLKRQIGTGNLMAISGCRTVIMRDGTISLPVGSGYSVNIALDADDTYTVRRIFKRGSKVWVKGEHSGVYCDDIGDVAYYCSCYKSNPTF